MLTHSTELVYYYSELVYMLTHSTELVYYYSELVYHANTQH